MVNITSLVKEIVNRYEPDVLVLEKENIDKKKTKKAQ